MIDAAIEAFDDADLRVAAAVLARRAAREESHPGWRGLWHALAVVMAEELDRRNELLDRLDPDLADGEAGALVDADQLAELLADPYGASAGPDGGGE